jgi:two-component system OmpR family sensor kinase
LRTPIAALTVQAQNLENAPNEADRIRRANELRTGLRRTSHLLDQLLDHARYAVGWASSSKTVDISAIAKSTVADLLPLAEEKAIDLGFVRADKARVRIAPAAFATVVQNLVGNALAYVPEGGHVDVAIAVTDGRATFSIDDDGPGIPADEIPAIVEPFKRGASAMAQGAGLGLSIVDRIVQAAGGQLDLGIPPNRQRCGLRVTVSLPLAAPRTMMR